jgi:EAL domain-containing protein (putative c-di-GMP-specific phosphodiesterase class I)
LSQRHGSRMRPSQYRPYDAAGVAASRNRLLPIMHLETGEAVLLFAETEKRFEERAVFGRMRPAAECSGAVSPAQWMADHIESVATDAHNRSTERPVIVELPLSALIDPDLAVACDAAIARTRLCPQEICFDVQDAALALPAGVSAKAGIQALRRCGFRVSLNATRSWQCPLSHDLRMLLDSLRVDARKIEGEEELQDRIEAAAASGMLVIAENAHWRDSYYLNELGVDYGLRMRADG